MRYQRLHIRVPASGAVLLSVKEEIKIEASVINVSAGGLCITAPSHIIEQNEYQIQVITPTNGKINFSGLPVYQTEESIGIKITSIDKDQLKTIYQVVGSFQLTDDFIKYIDEKDILHDWLVDESGEDIAITFETEPEKDNQKRTHFTQGSGLDTYTYLRYLFENLPFVQSEEDYRRLLPQQLNNDGMTLPQSFSVV